MAVAQHVGVHVGVEPNQKVVGHRGLDEQPGTSQADLARVVVLVGRRPCRGLKVAVCKHHQRPLTAELSGEWDDV